jgi:D-arabinose 1-dehydrogenase-like Zn-dependent alcohol dehydrogenase
VARRREKLEALAERLRAADRGAIEVIELDLGEPGAPRTLFDLVEAGQLDVRIHDRYPLEDTARAHTDLESGTTSGKLLVIP